METPSSSSNMSSSLKKEEMSQTPRIVWGYYLNNGIKEIHPKMLQWILIDPTMVMETFGEVTVNEWKTMCPFKCPPNGEGLFPLRKEEEETLVPLIITHMDDQPSWNLLNTPLTLPMPNDSPSNPSNSSPFQIAAKKMWVEMMQLKKCTLSLD